MNFDKNNAKVKEMDPFICEINDLIVKSKYHQGGQSLILHEDQKSYKPEFKSKSGIDFIPQHTQLYTTKHIWLKSPSIIVI